MKHSTDRILTTHVGSLIRPADIVQTVQAREAGRLFDATAFEARLKQAVPAIVKQQVEAGIDVPSDGELSKSSFSNYVDERLTGFQLRAGEPSRILRGRDRGAFAGFYAELEPAGRSPGAGRGAMVCTGAVAYKGQAVLARDIANFKAALNGTPVAEAFIPAIAPSTIELQRRNEHYKTTEEYLFAIADALRTEYKTIVDAGFILQLDDPRMVTEYDALEPEPTIAEYQQFASLRIDAINHAIEGLPADRMRYHVCWGSWHGPHTTDIELKHIVDLILRLKVGGFSIEAANGRHAHEWEVWQTTKLPDGAVLIPGVIAHTTNTVEHPDLVAQRLVQYATLVGRENVIAGVDCGFAQNAGTQRVHESIVWAKFRSMAEGARRASQQLWGK